MERSTITKIILSSAIAIALAMTLVGPTVGEDSMATNFRVDNGIFKLPQTEPFMRTVTVFLDGKVYDFMLESENITIFDDIEGVFTLIDAKRGVQTVVTMQFVNEAIERLATRAASKNDPETDFLYNPKFEPTQKDTATGELIFKSAWLTYRVNAKQGDVKAAKQYHRFADAYAKLNTVLRPGSKPPFVRILVNQTLAASTMLPKAVMVTYGQETDVEAPQFRSEHRHEMKLNKADQNRVAKIKKSLETLKVVTLEEYQKH